jgi:chemotaxis protein MotA
VVEFLQEAFKPIIAGKVKAEQLQEILNRRLDRASHHSHLPVMLLAKTGDAMPGIGIVAAVLGIIITMSSLGGPKEEIGVKVAHALVGTFLGILLSYGFMQPLTTRIELMGEEDIDYMRIAAAIIVAYASGAAPIVAADAGREFIPHDRAVEAEELEKHLKGLGKR